VSDNAFAFELPRVVVIGDEKSGKSSTIERLAMAPVFPRQDEFTMTRQPVLLKLRHSHIHPFSRPFYILTIPPCTDARGSVLGPPTPSFTTAIPYQIKRAPTPSFTTAIPY